MDNLIAQLAELLTDKKLMMATAESCTGGGVAQRCTAVAGSSTWFDSGIATYSNNAKQRLLGVSSDALEKFGAVSEEVAVEMVRGLLTNSDASVGVAITGIAGPGGGSEEKPVGTVCFAWKLENLTEKVERVRFEGDREFVRNQSVEHAIRGLIEILQ